MNVLECKNLYKSYGTGRYVLENMSLALPAGRIVGLLGPNGCGKSTLMKTVAGLLMPDSGAVSVAGTPVGEETKTLVSYLPERTYFNEWMRVDELVNYFWWSISPISTGISIPARPKGFSRICTSIPRPG